MNLRKIRLSDLRQNVKKPIDLFICSSSFETRCLAIANTLNPHRVRGALILEAIDLKPYTSKAAQCLKARFGRNSIVIQVSTKDPLFSADNISETVLRAFYKIRPKHILVDITTFTHEALLIFLNVLRTCVRSSYKVNITFAYTSATDYSIGNAVKFKWLSKGVSGVRTVLGFPGDSLPTQKTHLIILVGYEHERAARLIEIIEPNSISLGFGKSCTQTTEKNKNANQHFHYLLKRMAASYAKVQSFEIACNDPIQTRDAILNIASDHIQNNVLLAPMNNKMSTLGAALAAFACRQIQMCYAPVLEYNFHGYSKPGKTCYLFELPELIESGPDCFETQLS